MILHSEVFQVNTQTASDKTVTDIPVPLKMKTLMMIKLIYAVTEVTACRTALVWRSGR